MRNRYIGTTAILLIASVVQAFAQTTNDDSVGQSINAIVGAKTEE